MNLTTKEEKQEEIIIESDLIFRWNCKKCGFGLVSGSKDPKPVLGIIEQHKKENHQ